MSATYVTYQVLEHRLKDVKDMKKQYATKEDLSSTRSELIRWMAYSAGTIIIAIAGIMLPIYLSLDNRVGSLDQRFYILNNEVHAVKQDVAVLSANVETINKAVVKLTTAVENLEKSVVRLESNAQTTNETLLKLTTAVENLQKKEK